MTSQNPQLRRKNVRLALLLGGFALLVLITSFPFWQNIFQILGDAAR